MPGYDSVDTRVDVEAQAKKPLEISGSHASHLRLANNLSWAVNWFLLAAKLYCVIISSSKAILAALIDSVVDLLSQGILSTAEYYIGKHNPDYPVGRSRLEALSVLACAGIMSMASVEVIQYAALDLYDGFHGRIPELDITVPLYVLIGFGILIKGILFLYCQAVNVIAKSDALSALAEDHLNDVMSNVAALVTAVIAFHTPAWYIDPIGAILISLAIIVRWMYVMAEQVRKVVGHTAPPEFIALINKLAIDHDARLQVDCTRAYHFGSRYNVEIEIILPASMTVEESHDIGLALQHKIERLEDVERAFVHIDHQGRDGLEHKVERELVRIHYQAESDAAGEYASQRHPLQRSASAQPRASGGPSLEAEEGIPSELPTATNLSRTTTV